MESKYNDAPANTVPTVNCSAGVACSPAVLLKEKALTVLGSLCLLQDLCTFARALLCSTEAGGFDRGDFLKWPFLHLNAKQYHNASY